MIGRNFIPPPSQDIHSTQNGLGVLVTDRYTDGQNPTSYRVHLIMNSGKQVYIRDKRKNIEGWHTLDAEDILHFIRCVNPHLN